MQPWSSTSQDTLHKAICMHVLQWADHVRQSHTSTCTYIVMYICTRIVVHEMHGRMHHNHCQITNLLAHDPLSSLAYPMLTHTPPLAGYLLIKTLVARQQPTNICTSLVVCADVHIIYSSYLTGTVVHEMHGRMHHNHCQITNLLAHDPLSSLAYSMMTHPLPLASN